MQRPSLSYKRLLSAAAGTIQNTFVPCRHYFLFWGICNFYGSFTSLRVFCGSEGYQDGSEGKSGCYQTWQPEFNPWKPHGRKELTPASCPLPSTYILWHIYSSSIPWHVCKTQMPNQHNINIFILPKIWIYFLGLFSAVVQNSESQELRVQEKGAREGRNKQPPPQLPLPGLRRPR